ncbi:pantothenate transporter liz1 [Verticillium alfalfae VaMs.102]|uniref:Pantothenate transporter liz1 n=1 Tax=Verticillium alfalfae (strain VaMs.102 / ATCC MYA-4576 / FGSC 10136) TaxID=526221 RepID=C9SX21_VERA1|nr:pantothenate transporter liz1 [Verticillium alfalfae VaMs.102]EEY23562.1 pantothenate transporter liz1 [Verticillium alfalfae VaMs.102]
MLINDSKSNELAKRAATFTVAGQVGKMFAGAMMAAIHESMDGYAGLAGWQWVFLIDGIITFPVAIFGFFLFPDIPEITEAFYLKSYVCCVFSALSSAMQGYIVQGLMLLFMKSHQKSNSFTQSQVNTYPIPTHAIGIVAELGASVIIDRYDRRVSIGLVICLVQIACSIVLLVPGMSLAGNLTAFYLSSTSYGINPLLYSWSSNIAARTADDAARSVILASMAASDGLLWTFWGIVLYPASDAPYWRTGYIAMICVCVVLSSWLFLVRWLDRYTARKHPAPVRLLNADSSIIPSYSSTNEKKV